MSSNIKFISYLATIEAEFLQKSSAFLGQVLHYHTLDANLQRKKPYNIMVFLLSSFPFYFTWNWKRSTFCQLEPSRARMYQALQTWSGREVFRISTFIERKLIQIFIFSFIHTRRNKLRFKNKLNIKGKMKQWKEASSIMWLPGRICTETPRQGRRTPWGGAPWAASCW